VAKDETMTTKNGVLPYTIEGVADDATLTARAGLPLVIETMRAVGLSDALDRTLLIRRRNSGATDAQKVEALVLLMAAGGECVDDIEVLRADKGLMRLVGGLPSADEYRDGNVPAAMSNLRLIQRGFAALPSTVVERFFRADSAC
jgi:hypothetical protein